MSLPPEGGCQRVTPNVTPPRVRAYQRVSVLEGHAKCHSAHQRQCQRVTPNVTPPGSVSLRCQRVTPNVTLSGAV